jgi:competence protein ComEC
MMQWGAIPFIRYVLFLSFGILFEIYLPNLISQAVWWLALSLVGFLLSQYFLKGMLFYRYHFVMGLFALSSLFFFGIQLVQSKDAWHNPNHLVHEVDTSAISHYFARVDDLLVEKPNSWKTVVEVLQVYKNDTFYARSGKILVYVAKSADVKPQYGDILMIKGFPAELDGPKNPHEFDFKRFISFQQIHFQHYLAPESFHIMANQASNKPLAYALFLRDHFAALLTSYVSNPTSLQIAKALVLGIKDDLDSETQRAYASAGAMHVLAVSGLHVGIIYGIILFLIGKWKDHQQRRWLFLIISLSVLWFYAMITGLSPSVKRAATMFSFVVVAQVMQRNSNIYNTLAASAFFLLCFNPYLLMSVGFQLSYCAVLGIVYLHPRIYHLWYFNNGFIDKVWSITCVSIAAQFATAPLGLLYFHQFPTYFFVSNLLVIPAAFVILFAGLATLFTSPVPVVASFCGWVLSWLIELVNKGVFFIERLPMSTLEGIFISTPQSWMIYGMLLSLIALFESRKFGFLYAFIAFLGVYQLETIWRKHTHYDRLQFTVYHVNNHSAWEISGFRKHFIRVDEALATKPDMLKFHLFPNQMHAGLLSYNLASIAPDAHRQMPITAMELPMGELVQISGKRILHWKTPLGRYRPEDPLSVDYVIVSSNAVRSVEELLQICTPELVILDSSNKTYLMKRFLSELETANLPTHNVATDAAFQTILQ